MAICEQKFAKETESCLLFPSRKIANLCRTYIRQYYLAEKFVRTVCVRLVELAVVPPYQNNSSFQENVTLHVVLFPKDAFSVAKSFWQHTGDGISSRLAEYVLGLMQAKQDEQYTNIPTKTHSRRSSFKVRYCNPQISNPERISPTDISSSEHSAKMEENCYVEERYGRNLPISFADKAKIALKRRIAGVLGIEKNGNDLDEVITRSTDTNERGVKGVTENDVYLFPTGMSSIFHTHQFLLEAFQPKRSICFG